MTQEEGDFARLVRRIDMLLSCPDCTTSYQIPDDAVGSSGRKVKCQNCGHVWHAMPQAAAVPVPAKPAEAPVQETSLGVASFDGAWDGEEHHVADAPSADRELDELRGLLKGTGLDKKVGEAALDDASAEAGKRAVLNGSGQAAAHTTGRRAVLTPVRMATVAALAGVIAGGALWLRNEVVSVLPGAAGVYAAIGYPVNLRGLEFHNVGFETLIENGLPVLSVRGEVVNVTDKPVQVPDISYSLRNHRKQEIYVWTGKPSMPAVQPAGRAAFSTRLLAPPIGAEQVEIRFVPGNGAAPRG